VESDRHSALDVNELVADFDVVTFGRLRAEICANAPVDGDAPGRDQFIAFSPRTNPGCGKELIETHETLTRPALFSEGR